MTEQHFELQISRRNHQEFGYFSDFFGTDFQEKIVEYRFACFFLLRRGGDAALLLRGNHKYLVKVVKV